MFNNFHSGCASVGSGSSVRGAPQRHLAGGALTTARTGFMRKTVPAPPATSTSAYHNKDRKGSLSETGVATPCPAHSLHKNVPRRGPSSKMRL